MKVERRKVEERAGEGLLAIEKGGGGKQAIGTSFTDYPNTHFPPTAALPVNTQAAARQVFF
jgi:hypothetical protein